MCACIFNVLISAFIIILIMCSNILCKILFSFLFAAHGLELESILVWPFVHVSPSPGGEDQDTAVCSQHTVPHGTVSVSHRHG